MSKVKFSPVEKFTLRGVGMPGTLTVWSALPVPSRSDPESCLELGADAWRSQGRTAHQAVCGAFGESALPEDIEKHLL